MVVGCMVMVSDFVLESGPGFVPESKAVRVTVKFPASA